MKKKIISLFTIAAMVAASVPVVSMAANDNGKELWSDNFDSYKNTVEYYHEKKLDYNNKVLVDGTLSTGEYTDIKGITLYTTSRDSGDDSSYWQLTKDAKGKNALTTQVSRFSSGGRGAKIEFAEEYAPTDENAIVLKFDVKYTNDAETAYDESIQLNGSDALQIDFADGLAIEADKWATVKVVMETWGTNVYLGDAEEPALELGATTLKSINFNGLIGGVSAGDAIKAESNPFGYPTISLDNMSVTSVAATEAPEDADPSATDEPTETPDPSATDEPTETPDPAATVEPTLAPEANFAKVSDWAEAELEKAVEANLVPAEMLSDDMTAEITRAEFAAVAVKLYEKLSGTIVPDAKLVAFGDITDSEYMTYINAAYVLDIVRGVSETDFAPDASLTREQLATMLTRVIKKVSLEGWTIDDDANFQYDVKDVAKFADDAEISAYANNSVYYMAQQGFVKGMDDTHFAPLSTATREQAVAIALRCIAE
ncbi:MAG: S-layer homology domain-containing protein [Oscillospiraceae bacterium]|nr:S-layer homology domain-containing protein [Oscillospiraceae bacterium]